MRIRREFIVEDAFRHIYEGKADLIGNMRILFIDAHGNQEDGIDAGGLMKEFMTKLCEQMFDPAYGYFQETPDHSLYPSRLAKLIDAKETEKKEKKAKKSFFQKAVGLLGIGNEKPIPNYLQLFEFCGMMVGKALIDGILLKVNFARFFLNKIVEKSNQVDDLQALDAELYENLMKVKYYDGDVEDFGLTMLITEDVNGKMEEVELVKNGGDIPITNENRLHYIALYSNYMLNLRTREPTAAFTYGLHKIIPQQYLSYFFPNEI